MIIILDDVSIVASSHCVEILFVCDVGFHINVTIVG